MNKRTAILFLLVIYLVLLIKIIVLKDLPMIRIGRMMFHFGGTREGRPNLVPFKTIFNYLRHPRGIISFVNLVGNVIALVPLGVLAPMLHEEMNGRKAILLAFVTAFIIETAQAVLRVGIFDIDDVLLNGLGVILGFFLVKGRVKN